MALTGRTVLFFAGPLYEDLELWYPKIRLEEEGARTVVAGTGEKTYQGKRGYPLTVDTSVDEISSERFDGLVIPGGYAPDIMRRSAKLLQLTREIFEARKPVAFICHAGWVPIYSVCEVRCVRPSVKHGFRARWCLPWRRGYVRAIAPSSRCSRPEASSPTPIATTCTRAGRARSK